MRWIQVEEIVKKFQLEVVSGQAGLQRRITTSDLARPGLELAGYFTYHPTDRIQILGMTELSFLSGLPQEDKVERLQRLCVEETPCICLARGLAPPPELVTASTKVQLPVLRSKLTTTKLISKLTNYLERELAPRTTMHGVLVEIYGVGVLLTGGSGIGKSETALELVKRGHRFVADDAVEIRQTADNELIGTAPEIIRHLLEIRGVGIINVLTLFGAGAIRLFKKVSVICCLETWDESKHYDRLGLDEEKVKIMDTDLPQITIPVRPGRNLAVIVEVAAMNFRLKQMGINAAETFSQRLTEAINTEAIDENEEF